LGVDDRRDLPDLAGKAAIRPDRSDACWHAYTNEGQILLRKLGPHFHLPAFRKSEESAGALAYDLPNLDVARQDESGGRRSYVESSNSGASGIEVCLRHADPRNGRVASREAPVDVRLGNEAAADQRLSTLELVLRERGIGSGNLHLRRELRSFLALHRPLNRRENLALADPAAGIDGDASDLTALSGNADGLIAPRGQSTARGDRARDLASARDDHGDGRDLPAPLGSACAASRTGFLAAAPRQHEGEQNDDERQARSDQQRTPAARTVHDHQRVRTFESRCFPVHSHFFRLVRESRRPFGVTVLRE
jgi:hypothetical protein